MVRLTKSLFVHWIGAWLSFAGIEQLPAQESVDLDIDTIRIADLGLEDSVPSATDLVGPEHGPAGRNRAALIHRLRCWIDGTENCSVADLNDPRVREIRRFLGQSTAGQHGTVAVYFSDQTGIEVHLARVPELDPDDWSQSAYELKLRSETVQAPGLPAVPSGLAPFDAFAYKGRPAIRVAL